MDNKFQKGQEKFVEVFGEGNQAAFQSIEEIAPGFGKHIVEFAFGDIFCRDGLSLKQRELILIASLTTLGGCESWLKCRYQLTCCQGNGILALTLK